jgi:uncharacterized protein (TIGR03437 family)
MSLDFGGTTVKVNGEYVPVLSVSSSKIQFLCPSLAAGTQLEIAVETAVGVSGSLRSVMEAASPRIFTLDRAESSQGVVSFLGTADLAMLSNAEVSAHPAQPDDELMIWATGLGSSSELWPAMVSVKLGGVDITVDSVKTVPGYAGVFTVQFRVPVIPAFEDHVPTQLQVVGAHGNAFSSNTVTVSVEPARQ